MKLAVALAVVIGSSAFAAPTDDLILKGRTKKSAIPYGASGGSYGASYGPPCAGAAPLAPIALYLAPQGAPHYREEGVPEEVPEEHNEHARSYEGASYGAPASSISLASAASGGAIGYFPHGKIGHCGVPLLLSCSPNVVAGHLAQGHGYSGGHGYSAGYGYSAPAYKQTEKEEETTELREAMRKSQVESEANNLGPHHHHLNGVFPTDDHKALGEHTHNSAI